MAEVPVIQILDKKNYFKQALVPVPDALPPPLKESSIQIRTEALALTTNNFAYCRVGDLLGWWDVHPIPESTPAPYNDTSVYGRINCWGYAKVLDSTFDGVPKGSYVWGYLPIGTLPQNLRVKAGDVPGQVLVTDAFRQKQLPIYNRYLVFPASVGGEIEAKSDGVAYDALIRVMHTTAYLMTDFMYPADPARSVCLTPQQADLAGATVVAFAPGSKVGQAFAYLLRQRAGSAKPYKIIGAASEYSRAYVESTGVYDEVVSTTADGDPASVLARLGASKDAKVAVFDFGGRAGAAWKWAAALLASGYARTQITAIGADVSDPTAEGAAAGPPQIPGLDTSQVNASGLLTAATEREGEREFFEAYEKAWGEYRGKGIKGVKVVWGEGMEDVREGWDRFTRNEVKADEGWVFKV
ncbi:Chromatin structure remodeling complex protein sfh1 [Hypoxylon texense]